MKKIIYTTNKVRTENYFKKFNRIKLLKSLIGNNPIILDIGANKGQSTEEFLKNFKKPKIHCFEPQDQSINILRKKFKNNNKVIINQSAIHNLKKKVKFYYHDFISPNTSGLSGLYKLNTKSQDSINLKNLKKEHKKKYVNQLNKFYILKTSTMKDYIIKNKINNIDLVKIDTQGNEDNILKGFGKYLKKIKIIVLEIMLYDIYSKKLSFFDIEKILRPYGFELYDISHISKNPLNGRTDWVDVVYKRSNS